MKTKLFTLVLIVVCCTLMAQTEISGKIDENTAWTKLNSPYIIKSGVVIMDKVILTIEPGVSIQIESNAGIVVRGSIIAKGTKEDTIYIAPKGSESWQGITIDNNFRGVARFDYVSASKAETLLKLMSYSSRRDTVLILNNCRFFENKTVIEAQGDGEEQISIIKDCKFENTYTYCFLFCGNCNISGTKFINNWELDNSGGDRKGLYSSGNTNAVIEECEFSGLQKAVSIKGKITNSEFYNNGIAVITMGNSSPYMRYNNIYDNYIGIQTWIYSGSNPVEQIQHNKICNNEFNVYQIYSGDVNIANNCWCTNDENEISEKIYDIFSDNSLGLVIFTPIDTVCDNFSSMGYTAIGHENHGIESKIFPNPASDILNIMADGYVINEINIVNIYGAIIKSNIPSNDTNNNSIQINIGDLEQGLYFLGIKKDNQWFYNQFVKN